MITSFEVGSIFRIIDEASPGLRKILKQVRELQAAIDKAKLSMSELTKFTAPAGIAAAVSETNELAASWKRVSEQAAKAGGAMGRAAAASRGALPPIAPGGSGGNIFRPGARGYHGGGGGAHITGPGIGLPGGGHMRFGSGVGAGAGMAALGLLGYGVYQAMNYDDAAVLMAQHAGVDLATNRDKFRKILEDASIVTGYGEHDVALAAQQELRMFGDTGGSNGVNVLPKMLKYAATEARLKGTSLEESMTSLVGLAHMLRKYGAADVDQIAPAFSALSTRNPMSLPQQERAFGYAVPLLHSGMGLDPFDTMAASTALARAGITSTKAGTWIRQLMVGGMPGTSLITQTRFNKHEAGLKALGLVDESGKPTWFENGKPSEMRFLNKLSETLAKLSVEQRIPALQAAFGKQGSGAAAVLAEPAVQQQLRALRNDMTNPRTVNSVRNFMSVYNEQSSLQNARTTLQTFSVLMADIGTKVLPVVNDQLRDFKKVLETLHNMLPGNDPNKGAFVTKRAALGGEAGAGIGFFTPVGPLGGAAIGASLFAAEAAMQLEVAKEAKEKEKPADRYLQRLEREGVKPPQVPSINFSLNVDGRTLAQAIVDKLGDLYRFDTNSPAANGAGIYGP